MHTAKYNDEMEEFSTNNGLNKNPGTNSNIMEVITSKKKNLKQLP